MKTIPPPCPEPDVGPKYWRSLDQLADTPEFREWLEREFPAGITDPADPVSRRHFVKIMSASFLLAGLGATGCRRPVEHIIPFSKAPADYTHGVAKYYASAMPSRGSAIPLLVRSHEGRPIKIEGNPDHPDSNGGTDQFAQASILSLYDPDRAARFTKSGAGVPRSQALDALSQLAKGAQGSGGRGLCFLMERSSSPSRARVQKLISEKYPQARWFIHEPVDFDVHRAMATAIFGKPVRPYYKFDQADVIVSLDCDFLGTEEDTFIHIRRFAGRRNPEKDAPHPMNRLYAVESLYTLTGANADHRLRVAPSAIPAVAARLAQEILNGTGQTESATALAPLAAGASGHEKWIVECAKDVLSKSGRALIVAGHRQPEGVQALAQALNVALGSIGHTVVYHDAPAPAERSLAELAQALNAGEVEQLVILGANPVYTAPADLSWKQTQRKAKNIVRLGYYEDETFEVCDWHLPMAHYLESWGDARTADGTLVPIQPLIEPLFSRPGDGDNGGLTELEVLARIGGLEQTSPYEIARETFRSLAGTDDEKWKKFLHDGFLPGSASAGVQVQINVPAVREKVGTLTAATAPSKDRLDVLFHRDYSLDDGRFNNNGWLQEIPDPITKLAWDNAFLVSPATAEALGMGKFDEEAKTMASRRGLFHSQVVQLQLNGRNVEGPLWIQPGLADNTVALALGYGREKAGRVGRLQEGRPAGFNAYAVRASASPHFQAGGKLNATTQAPYPIANTQEHGAMGGRPIVREANKSQFDGRPDFAKNMDIDAPSHAHHIPTIPDPRDPQLPPKPRTIYGNPPLTGTHQWAMSIDLNTCVGCTACVVACQSENNIPIVGKEQVIRGREMSWIRIDRYYAGEPADPQIANLPMLCQHCENAPCENVCPVNATVHDEEGLNLMVYNRCVGTRYCSNNCPYKVRRFNYFDYNRRPLHQLYRSPFAFNDDGEWEMSRWYKNPSKGTIPEEEWELVKLVKNPDVTVRMRGVMEKCTFCVQRIEQAKIAQKVRARDSGDVKVPDGTFKTACQQACPADAIVFGDISDPESRVAKLKKRERDYTILGYLDTRPRTTYLARIRNPNPQMPDYHQYPLALKEYVDERHDDPFQSHGSGHGAGGGHGHEDPKKGAH